MQIPTADTNHTTDRWRRNFDLGEWFSRLSPKWISVGAQSAVSIEPIGNANRNDVWSEPTLLRFIVDGLLSEMIVSSLPGSSLQVKVRLDEAQREWATIEIRDRTSARPDSWELPEPLNNAARQLEGFIDIAVESGRTTTCAISFPTGSLPGWLRRNRERPFVYAVDCIEGRWSGDRDRLFQRLLNDVGSLHRLNETAYLVACKRPILTDRISAIESDRTLTAAVRMLGSMQDFVKRLDRAVRFDAAHESVATRMAVNSPADSMPRDAHPLRSVVKPSQSPHRLRPRRVV